MPTKPPHVAASRRSSAQLDQTVNLTNYEEDDSDRVETWTATASSPHAIPARADLQNQPRKSGTVRESGDAEVDARIHVPDDASGVDGIHDGGGKGASVIAVAGYGSNYGSNYGQAERYRVIVRHDDGGGLLRLDCERID